MQPPTPNPTPNNYNQNYPLGATALFGEIVLAIAIAAVVKTLAVEVPVAWILFMRFIFCVPFLALEGWRERGKSLYQINQKSVLLMRSAVGLTALACWYLAVQTIDITLAVVLTQTLTIFITILAPIMLGEKIGPKRIMAVCIGFIGVMVLVWPNLSVENPSWLGIGYSLSAAFGAALMFIYLRKLGDTESAISTALSYNTLALGMMALICFSLYEVPQLSTNTWLLLIGIGVTSSVQQFLMAYSHSVASASALAPVHYTAVPLSMAFGMVVFNETLNPEFFVGTSLIVGATLFIFIREQQLKRQTARQQ